MDLKVKERKVLGKKVKTLRREGLVPAELFGHNFENQHLKVSEKDFRDVYREAGKSSIINLDKDGEGKIPALIYNVQVHPISRKPLSVDFYRIRENEKITTEVPLVFVGEAPAEKEGLVVVKVIDELEIESLPKDIPHEIKVDLTGMKKLEDKITIKDLNIPEGVEVQLDEDSVIVIISEKQEEIVEETPTTTSVLDEDLLGDDEEITEGEDPLADSPEEGEAPAEKEEEN